MNPSLPNQFWKVPSTLLSLIGRTQEIEEIQDLLTAVRLLTLVGAGGIGKTRLSLQLAHKLRPRFPDGVCFVSLTTTNDPEQVMSLIAHVLGLRDESESPYERVQEFLREKEWLLESDDMELAQKVYAFYYLKLAEEATQAVAGPQQGTWLDRLE